MRSGLPVFNKAAKNAYCEIPDSEKDELRQRCTTRTKTMTKKEIVREGVKLFQKMQKVVGLHRVGVGRECLYGLIPNVPVCGLGFP